MNKVLKITETPERSLSVQILNDGVLIRERLERSPFHKERWVVLSYAEMAKMVALVSADGQAQ